MAFNQNIPCKIGDTVYAIRNHRGIYKIRSGKVSQMFYVGEEMRLCIVVDKVARGSWGKAIFPSYEEAEKYLKGRDDK